MHVNAEIDDGTDAEPFKPSCACIDSCVRVFESGRREGYCPFCMRTLWVLDESARAPGTLATWLDKPVLDETTETEP